MSSKNWLRNALLGCLRSLFHRLVRSETTSEHLEVERKFRICPAEVPAIRASLAALGFRESGTARMSDRFLPAAEKGEMLRVRREAIHGERRNILTRKRWVTTAGGGRERRETERHVGPLLALMLLIAGRLASGAALPGFSKVRELFQGQYGPGEVTVAIDEVSGLGEFSGLYLEVELLLPEQANPAEARDAIYTLAEQLLGCGRVDVKLSYMDMLQV